MQLCTHLTLQDFLRNRSPKTPENEMLLHAFAAFKQILYVERAASEAGSERGKRKEGYPSAAEADSLSERKEGVYFCGGSRLAQRAQRRRILLRRKQTRSASATKICPSAAEVGCFARGPPEPRSVAQVLGRPNARSRLQPSARTLSSPAPHPPLHSLARRLGLNHIHNNGIIHRDLKPGNIFVDKEGIFKIGDFGLSKLVNQPAGAPPQQSTVPLLENKRSSSSSVDTHTAGIGTASYAAPEQINSTGYDASADVFSLGLILLELCNIFGSDHERARAFHETRRGDIDAKFERRCVRAKRERSSIPGWGFDDDI
jgi:hypothetical protein